MSAHRPADRSATERPHVLIVTADLGLRQFLGEGLLLGGFWTSTIASAIQVLEVFRLRTFDLVLVDALLPGLDGPELVRRLRGRSGRSDGDTSRTDAPLILIADASAAIDPAAAEEAGADGILVPPIELEEIVPLLHGVVARWRTEHPGRPYADARAHQPPADG